MLSAISSTELSLWQKGHYKNAVKCYKVIHQLKIKLSHANKLLLFCQTIFQIYTYIPWYATLISHMPPPQQSHVTSPSGLAPRKGHFGLTWKPLSETKKLCFACICASYACLACFSLQHPHLNRQKILFMLSCIQYIQSHVFIKFRTWLQQMKIYTQLGSRWSLQGLMMVSVDWCGILI